MKLILLACLSAVVLFGGRSLLHSAARPERKAQLLLLFILLAALGMILNQVKQLQLLGLRRSPSQHRVFEAPVQHITKFPLPERDCKDIWEAAGLSKSGSKLLFRTSKYDGSSYSLAKLAEHLRKQGHHVLYKKLSVGIAEGWTLRMTLRSRSMRAFTQLISKLSAARPVTLIFDDFQRASVGACLLCKQLADLATLRNVSIILAYEKYIEESHEAQLQLAGFRSTDWQGMRLDQWQKYLSEQGLAFTHSQIQSLAKKQSFNWFWANELVRRGSSHYLPDDFMLQNVRNLKEYYRDSRAVLELVKQQEGSLCFPRLLELLGPRLLTLKHAEMLQFQDGRLTLFKK